MIHHGMERGRAFFYCRETVPYKSSSLSKTTPSVRVADQIREPTRSAVRAASKGGGTCSSETFHFISSFNSADYKINKRDSHLPPFGCHQRRKWMMSQTHLFVRRYQSLSSKYSILLSRIVNGHILSLHRHSPTVFFPLFFFSFDKAYMGGHQLVHFLAASRERRHFRNNGFDTVLRTDDGHPIS